MMKNQPQNPAQPFLQIFDLAFGQRDVGLLAQSEAAQAWSHNRHVGLRDHTLNKARNEARNKTFHKAPKMRRQPGSRRKISVYLTRQALFME